MYNLRKFISVSAIVVLFVTTLFMPLSYVDAAKSWDSLTSNDLENASLQFVMPNNNVYLYAHTEANHYFVKYNGNTNTSGTMSTGEFIYDTTGQLAPNAYAKIGYTFANWNTQANGSGTSYADKANVWNWTTTESGVVPIYAQWDANSYNITYDLNDSTGTSTAIHTPTPPESLNYDQTGSIVNPSRTGYTFSGWNITNMDNNPHIVGGQASSATGATGIKGTQFKNLNATNEAVVNFLAKWSPNINTVYKVKHYKQNLDETYPTEATDTDNKTGITDQNVTPPTKIYEGFTAPGTQTKNINADGSTVFTYQYTRNSYKLTLNAGRGISSVKGVGSVNTTGASTTTTTGISFKYDEPVTLTYIVKPGYTGATWSGYLDASGVFNMPALNQEKTAYATPITYHITVDNKGGNDGSSSRDYTVESEPIILATPWRADSDFAGWIGTNIVGTSATVEIPTGSTGNRTYTATWTCHEGYTEKLDGTECLPNPDTQYTVRHVLQDLDGNYTILTGTVIQTGTTATETNARTNTYKGFTVYTVGTGIIKGDKSTVVDVKYNRLSYDSTITQTTGVTVTDNGAHDNHAPQGKHQYDDIVTISATTGAGYTFTSWTVKDANGNDVMLADSTSLTTTFKMPASAVTIKANVSVNTYTITYNLNSGSVNGNPSSYTVETPTFNLKNPARDHSVFVGWSGTDISGTSVMVTIAKGSVGNRTYEAIWSCDTGYHIVGNSCVANQYRGSVNFNDGGSHGSAEVIEFTYDQYTNLPNPEQSGYDFAGRSIYGMTGGVQHYIGSLQITGSTYSGATATGYKNLSTEQGMTSITFVAQWTPRNDTPYVVYHYIKNVGTNTYTLSGADSYQGTTDTDVIFNNVKKTFIGFTYVGGYVNISSPTTRPAGAGVATGNIEKDGSLKIYLYYDRDINHVYLSGNNDVVLTGEGDYEYGKEVTVTATPKTGYHFVRWEKRKSDRSKES